MMADAARRSYADQQKIKAAQQEIKELKQQINALEQENKDLKQRVGTLEISQEGQSVVASGGQVSEESDTPPSVEGILGHQLIQRESPFSSDEYVALENCGNMKALHKEIKDGTAFGHRDSCAICDGWIGDEDSYDPCNCNEDHYWACSCGVLLSKDRVEAEEQFRNHIKITKNTQPAGEI